ncbi:MAG: alpha-ketoglutarate-dependent dioxygenase AlkB [SAR86 cluster bacterium]|uniref:Alpha-ketoglutarate-dependent dioxygenase AlkB n=1 Tax=SAR86 cluster bacterium TaxID=2030880 RepID=A0A2A4X2H6_9GAMM|nr:MAG: alpha-ketoglutarate-dependent dioxygenase AlkB [SAR86 cluster bacterium]
MQANLFDGDKPLSEPIRHLIGNAELTEYPQIVNSAEATQMFETLIADIPWRQESLKIAGKLRAIPRLQCWMGDRTSEYGYSGVRLTPCPWHATVKSIHDSVAELSGTNFNSVLINFYRNGQDSVAWHADDEAELGDTPVIASVSLGAERIFELKHKQQTPARKYKLLLRHGSLLIMAGTMQQYWLHRLPKVKGLQEARINLTFRNIISD